MKKILITGVSGVGKTSVGKYLGSLGYESVDIEDIDGMFLMVHKGTKKVFEDYTNDNPEHIKTAEWICDPEKLKTYLANQKTELAFYTGIASNMDEIISFFDQVFILQPDSTILNERLKNREGTDEIGNNQSGRDVVLGWKDWWENEMSKKGAILINANDSIPVVGQKILKTINIL